MAARTRHITAQDEIGVTEEKALEKLRVMTGLTPADLDRVVKQFIVHIKRSHRGLVKLIPDSGGSGIAVKASSLTPTARSYESLRGVEIPGYRVERLPAIDIDRALEQTLASTATALIRAFQKPADAQKWLRAPNPAFDNQTPISVLENGNPTAIATVLNAASQGVSL